MYGRGLDPVSMSRDLDGSPASLEPALYLADGHSGVRQAIDLVGAVLAAYRYDAFGSKVSDVQQAGGLVVHQFAKPSKVVFARAKSCRVGRQRCGPSLCGR